MNNPLGQTRSVFIYRLVSQGCFEEKKMNIQIMKRQLALRAVDIKNVAHWFKKKFAAVITLEEPLTPSLVDQIALPNYINSAACLAVNSVCCAKLLARWSVIFPQSINRLMTLNPRSPDPAGSIVLLLSTNLPRFFFGRK